MQASFRINNFDLIRLMASLQVAVHHTMLHLEIKPASSLLTSLISYFPGVPIFFFVSGFLVSKSYENNSLLHEYATNRILRIYPALIICTVVTLFSIYLTGYFEYKVINTAEFVLWIAGQVSIFQFYNPEFMRGFGTGVMNGSLWTITVELQFYLMVPIFYKLFGLLEANNSNRKMFILILLFILPFLGKYSMNKVYEENILFKLFSVSFIPWIWMFFVGILFQKNFNLFHRIFSGKVLFILPLYIFISYYTTTYFDFSLGNAVNPILYIALSILVFSFAYSFPKFSESLLKRNDISYGIYIYHIPVVNILIYFGYTANLSYLVVAIFITILLACLSWAFIEKNVMTLKKHPLNPLNVIGK